MKNLLKVPSVAQILIAEFLSILCLSSFFTAAWNTFVTRTPGENTLADKSSWLWYLLGLALFLWSLREILRPRIKRDSWVNFKTWTDSGGDVLIVGHKGNDDFEELISKSSGNRGNFIEAVGRLREMPPRDKILKWKAYCGLEQLPQLPAGGRWVLELEEPP